MDIRLEGRTAIVTGAGDGIGAAITRRLLAEGARVVACDLSLEKLERAHSPAAGLLLLAKDVTADDASEALVLAALTEFGGLDILVNNAGVSEGKPIETATDRDFDFHMNVNLRAIFHLCRRAIPELRKSAHGRIINIASASAERGRAGLGIYSATKAAVIGLTKVLSVELGPDKITANCILPGPIWSGLSRRFLSSDPVFEKLVADETSLGRIGNPEEIAGAVFFLASDDSSFVTGHGLVVDGGGLVKA